jgi:hypothetical protein
MSYLAVIRLYEVVDAQSERMELILALTLQLSLLFKSTPPQLLIKAR